MDKRHAALSCQLDILNDWRDRYGNITIDELRTFLSIAINPKQSQKWHERHLELSHSTMSRYMQIMGTDGFRKREAMNLTSQEVNPIHWREVSYSLTVKGKATAQNLARSWDRYCVMVEEYEDGGIP